MRIESLAQVVTFFSAFLFGLSAAVYWTLTWRKLRVLDELRDTTLLALELLELMEQSQDPGRDVHLRFAAGLEAGMLRTEGLPDPAARRAAAMTMAAEMIGVIRRANLQLVAGEEPEPEA